MAISVAFVRADGFDCKNIDFGHGVPMDLSPVFADGPLNVTLEKDTPPSTTITTVSLDLCKPLEINTSMDTSEQCPKDTHVCTIVKHRRGSSEQVDWVIPSGGSPTDGYTKSYSDLSNMNFMLDIEGTTWSNYTQYTTLNILCSAKQMTSTQLRLDQFEPSRGKLKLVLLTPIPCPSTRHGQLLPERGLLSSLFWIILVVVALYLGVGIWYNYSHYGSNGWDVLPHRDFWREVPYMVQDAFRHVQRTMSQPSPAPGMSRSGYEPV